MKEQYLFRGKRKDNGEWVYGWLRSLQSYNPQTKQISSIYFTEISDDLRSRADIIVDYKTVGQSTGLEDKNGKMIFEGDVVKADGYIFIVQFGKCGGVANNENYGYMGYYLDGFDSMTKDALRLGLRNDICYFTDIEVIGNIHDNPELLEVEK